MRFLDSQYGIGTTSYDELWRWSVSDVGRFWETVWKFFAIRAARPYSMPLANSSMPGAEWFPSAELSFVDHVFRNATTDRPAILFRSERVDRREVSWAELEAAVASVASSLRGFGVSRGDRVASYMPNVPETVVAFLATASIGAIWSSCSPDFGAESVVDRFRQIEPKVLFAVDGYRYEGRDFDRRTVVRDIQSALPSLERTIVLRYLDPNADLRGLRSVTLWSDVLCRDDTQPPTPVPFGHPLWIVYTSGTTGLPKPIVHSVGGILLESLKKQSLHLDVGKDDTFFWHTTTGWVMWNITVGALTTGSTIALYDGSLADRDFGAMWSMAADFAITVLGTSAAFVHTMMKTSISPRREYDLRTVRVVGSTGSPLTPEGFKWVYDNVGSDVWLASISGGTDVCTAFVGASPLAPVVAGELQCRYLGADVHAFDEAGRPLIGEVGELVITQPMPSMPVFFWNDPDAVRYHESYFDIYPGVWRHGDWIKLTDRGTAIIYGRSDSTIKRRGVRIGTSDIYRVVEMLPDVADSLAIDLEVPGGDPELVLFVHTAEAATLTDDLVQRIRAAIRTRLSPLHMPDRIVSVPEIPRTLNGKKLEVPVKRILLGEDVASAVSVGAMANPQSLEPFVRLAASPADTRPADRERRP